MGVSQEREVQPTPSSHSRDVPDWLDLAAFTNPDMKCCVNVRQAERWGPQVSAGCILDNPLPNNNNDD